MLLTKMIIYLDFYLTKLYLFLEFIKKSILQKFREEP